jgi:hypothetical protein
MDGLLSCPRCGEIVSADAGWCARCGYVPGGAMATLPPARDWKRLDQIAILAWAATTSGAAAIWYQWLAGQTPPPDVPDWPRILEVIVAPLAVITLGLGAVAGAMIRRHGPKVELLFLAAVGAACMVLTVASIAASDPKSCGPASGCDISYAFGAILEFPFVVAPLLAGAAIGRGLASAIGARSAGKT